MYKRIRTPNSPLMPLSPMSANMETNDMIKTPKNHYLPPSLALPTNRVRRSFTPCNSNVALSPPSVSPIVKRHYATPQNSPNNKLIKRSANTSIKMLRSSVRCLFKFTALFFFNRHHLVISYISLSFFLAQKFQFKFECILDRKKSKCENAH